MQNAQKCVEYVNRYSMQKTLNTRSSNFVAGNSGALTNDLQLPNIPVHNLKSFAKMANKPKQNNIAPITGWGASILANAANPIQIPPARPFLFIV